MMGVCVCVVVDAVMEGNVAVRDESARVDGGRE